MNIPLLVFISCFILTFILRIPILLGMLMSSIYYFVLAPGPAASVQKVAAQLLTKLNVSFILIAIPLFIFTAKVMNTGKVTEMVFKFANILVGKWRGGMGHVNVIASLIFSGMTGSATADASGLGIIEIETMRKQNYDDGFSCAITAASATIGPIFPPSIPMVIYAMFSGASIGKLFLGGMIPGILIAITLMIYVSYIAKKRNYPTGESYYFRELIKITIKAFPALLTPVIILSGIYTGIVTVTEAAALAGFYAMVISFFIYRTIGIKQLLDVIIDTVKTTGTISLLVGAAFVFSYILAIEHIPDILYESLTSITQNKYLMLFIINIVFIILGMIVDTSCISVIFVPMVLPLVNALGIDLVHFGVVIVLNMMIGLSTPPYGMLLFIVSGISGTPLKAIIKEIFPMFMLLIGVLFLITFVPEIVMFLPNTMWK